MRLFVRRQLGPTFRTRTDRTWFYGADMIENDQD